jgi:hypothetical protein
MKTVTEVLAEMVKMMDDADEPGAGSDWHCDAVAALAAATAQQPVAGDSRESFEEWAKDKGAMMLFAGAYSPAQGWYYFDEEVQTSWNARQARQIAALRAVIADLEAQSMVDGTSQIRNPAGLFTAIDAQAARRAEREAAAGQCAAGRRAEDDVSATPTQGEKP